MDIADRLDQLERRVAELERRPDPPPVDDGEARWALDALVARVEPPGAVLLVGAVTLADGRVARWQETRGTAALVDGEEGVAAEALAALGSPIRLRLLLRVLAGAGTVQELTSTEGIGTSGQVYHHLRQLTAAGWVRSRGGGAYEVPTARIVPLLGALLVAGG
ncbi:MAG TPA: hypothetical protein VK507_20815 [Iamia sp.]|nr:hypothetical protein [Iamia sp.]